MLMDMHTNVQFRLRMNGVGVTQYVTLKKGMVQGSKVGSQIYTLTDNMATRWIQRTSEGFTCKVRGIDLAEKAIRVVNQTHMDDAVDVSLRPTAAKDLMDKRNEFARVYTHPLGLYDLTQLIMTCIVCHTRQQDQGSRCEDQRDFGLGGEGP